MQRPGRIRSNANCVPFKNIDGLGAMKIDKHEIAELLEAHHRYLMTDEGDPQQIVKGIRALQRAGLLNRKASEALEAAMKPSDLELKLQRLEAGESLDSVYDSGWRSFVHLCIGTLWFGAYATVAEFALKYYDPPADRLIALLVSASVFVAIVIAAVFTHERTTGRIIDRLFDRG
jgi:hypothetical protein